MQSFKLSFPELVGFKFLNPLLETSASSF
uniref:Uncharacterized protein n=1 Tax=Arundo donax TaxID=35708 RepID=A0A0A8ZUC9_ARUDO